MLDRLTQLYLGPYLVKDLSLTNGQIGLLASVVAIGWAGSSLVFGRLSDRLGRKIVLVPAMIIFSLLSGWAGLAHSFRELLLARFLLGVAEGPSWAVIMALMEGASQPKHRGRNLGFVNSFGSLFGSAIGPVLATQLAEAFGWRSAFFSSAIPGIALALAIALIVPEPDRGAGHLSTPTKWSSLLKSPNLWLCFLGSMSLTLWLFSFNAFAPLYLTHGGLLKPTDVGWILGASGVGGTLVSLIWPTASDRLGRRPAIISAAVLAFFLPSLFLIPGLHSNAPLLALIAFFTSTGPALAILFMVIVPVEIAGRRASGAALGFTAIGGEFIGATCGPAAGGLLADRFGPGAPLLMGAAATLVMIAAGWLLAETRRAGSSEIAEVAAAGL
jgi:predicted MFS family arabinose efflux permease